VNTQEALSLPPEELLAAADAACRSVHGDAVFLRGLIEVTNHCVRNCLYCGIRRGNGGVSRYRLTDGEILASARAGQARGLRSFVLQGGEDPEFGPARLARLAGALRAGLGEGTALTFSFGTMRKADYAGLKAAGCDRYLIRFETSDPRLHESLRGSPLSERLLAIDALRDLGFEVGSGFMTGLPGAGLATLESDVRLCGSLGLDMVGIGPFIPHPATPLAGAGRLGIEPALRACAAVRLALPGANMPATTAAGSVAADGRERMLAAGANVLMPNVGPTARKRDYELYPGKICLDEDGLQCIGCLDLRVRTVGKRLDFSRGDSPTFMARHGRMTTGGQQ
jgi:biotin synthase